MAPRGIGVDVGVVASRGRYLVSSSDPITGARRRIGWYAVNVNANDVATSGIMPEGIDVVALFPEGSRLNEIQELMEEIVSAASELGITVSKGHTEVTGSVKRPVVAVTAFGSGDRFVTAADARPGDAILMTKTAGLEGTSILAGLEHVRRSLSAEVCGKGERLIEKISVVTEAGRAFKSGKVHAMHDVTEGGVMGAVFEMASASKLGFEIDADSIPVDPSTRAICGLLSVQPLRLIGSGALLVASAQRDAPGLKRAIEREGIRCSTIGKFLPRENQRRVVARGSATAVGESSVQEELWPTLKRYS